MEYKSVKGFSGWGQLGFLFAFLGAGFVLAAIAQLLCCLKVYRSHQALTVMRL